MNAGSLNNTITFQRASIAYGTVNNQIQTWADAFTVYAAVFSQNGREFYAAQKLNEETEIVFKIRFREGINTNMRIKYGNRNFEIIPPINDANGKRIELLISAKEVV